MVNVNRDNSKILSLYKAPGRLVAIGMGDLGKISRIVAPFLGAEFTYASLTDDIANSTGTNQLYPVKPVYFGHSTNLIS